MVPSPLGREPQHVGTPRPRGLEAAGEVDRVDVVAIRPHVCDRDDPTLLVGEVGLHLIEDRAHLGHLILARVGRELDLDDVDELVRDDPALVPLGLLDLLRGHGLEARVQEILERPVAHHVRESRLSEHRVTRVSPTLAHGHDAVPLHEGLVLLLEPPLHVHGPADALDGRHIGVACRRPHAHHVRGETDAIREPPRHLRVVEVDLPENGCGLHLLHGCLPL